MSVRQKRRWYNIMFIEQKFLGRQLLRLLYVCLFTLALSMVALGLFYFQSVDNFSGAPTAIDTLADNSGQKTNLNMTGINMIPWLAVILPAYLLAVFLIGVYFAGKIGGPLYRFKKTMSSLAHGDLTVEANIRKGDEFQDLAILINSTLARIQLMVMSIQENINTIKESQANGDPASSIHSSIEALESAVGYFKTVDIVGTPLQKPEHHTNLDLN